MVPLSTLICVQHYKSDLAFSSYWGSLHGAVVMSVALQTRGRRFDPGLLQSVG